MSRHPRRLERLAALSVVSAALALTVTGLVPAGEARQATAARVTVTFTNTTLRVTPSSPESGRTTFVVYNKGKKAHVLLITGPGLEHGARTSKITGGRSATLTVTLRPGMYQLSDPVGLGVYSVQYLDIIPATTVAATGNSSVVTTPPTLPPMCGDTYTP